MPYGINNYSLYPEQPNAGLQNITGGTGPQLNFEMDSEYANVGDVGRDTEGVYRGQGTGGQSDYTRSLSAQEYDIAQGFRPSNTNQFAPPTWNTLSMNGGDGIGTPMRGAAPPQSVRFGGVAPAAGGVQFMPNSTPMGTTFRDQIAAPTGGAQPAPYNPRAQEDDIYRELKAMLADPDSFTGTEYFKDMMRQREQARLRARRGSRFSGKSMIDFERGGAEDAAGLYDRRIQELLGGSGEERTRWAGAEGADRAGYQMGMDAWKSKLGSETGVYSARLADAWNRDKDVQQTTYAANLERNLQNSYGTPKAEDPNNRFTPNYGAWGRM